MNSNFPDENLIREYLLGTLPEKDWNEIEEKLLSDKEFAEFADSIEDEIIEEYLTIQNHFLRPPERQRKLLFASVLHSKLKKSANEPIPIDRMRKRPKPRLYWAMAAAVALLLVSTLSLTVYTASLHSEVTTAKAKSNQVESRLAEANKENLDLRNRMTAGDNVVDLGATLRGDEKLHRFPVAPGTKSLRIRLPVNEPSALYSVELRRGDIVGKPQWSQDNLQPDSNKLDFIIPYFGPGPYFLNVSRQGLPPSTSPRRYQFALEEQQQSHTSALNQ